MRVVILVCLLCAAPALGKGLGIKTEDPKLQAFADLDDEARYDAWERLVKAGAESVPVFESMLAEKHMGLRALGGNGLARLGPLAGAAVPALGAIVKDGEIPENVRLVSITALGNIGPAAKAHVPELRRALEAESKIERITSAVALAKIDPTTEGLPKVTASMIAVGRMETPHGLRVAARLGPRAKGCRDGIIAVARGGRGRAVRVAALRALDAVDGKSDATRAFLGSMLGDKDPRVALEAAALLAANGTPGKEAGALLAKGLASDDRVARVVAAVAILRHEPACVNSTFRLLVALDPVDDPGEAVRVEALEQLRRMGRGAAAYADQVAPLAPRSSARVEGLAALTLWAITGDRERTLPVAKHALTRGYFEGCADVVRLVRKLER